MKRKITTYAAIALAVFMASCKENEPMEYSDDGRVVFYEMGLTSWGYPIQVSERNYSFTLVPFDQNEIETTLSVRLVGRIADHDRSFTARVIQEGTTAVEGTHFRLHDGVMEAGEYWAVLPITLLRTPDMQNESVSIVLEIAPTGDLGGGARTENGIGDVFTLHVGDFLMQPQNWPQLYFGLYSTNKYRFVIATLGVADFPVETRWDTEPSNGTKFTISEMYMFQYRLREAYAEYKLTNPPIWMDDDAEEKVEISFQYP